VSEGSSVPPRLACPLALAEAPFALTAPLRIMRGQRERWKKQRT
jgi:hypothetical protein